MKKFNVLVFTLIFFLVSCAPLKQIITEPTSLETISAVKQVLNSSAFRAIKTLRKIDKKGINGFVPPELQPILETLKKVGLEKEIEKVNKKVGIVSKIMADESAGIIQDAVKEIKFKDAVKIVVGGENAATHALKQAMYKSVKKRYSARLETELNKTEVTKYWPVAANTYNLFAKKKVSGSFSDFMAERAVDALFLTMGKEESKIRKDPKKLGKAVVTKVFEYYKKKKK